MGTSSVSFAFPFVLLLGIAASWRHKLGGTAEWRASHAKVFIGSGIGLEVQSANQSSDTNGTETANVQEHRKGKGQQQNIETTGVAKGRLAPGAGALNTDSALTGEKQFPTGTRDRWLQVIATKSTEARDVHKLAPKVLPQQSPPAASKALPTIPRGQLDTVSKAVAQGGGNPHTALSESSAEVVSHVTGLAHLTWKRVVHALLTGSWPTEDNLPTTTEPPVNWKWLFFLSFGLFGPALLCSIWQPEGPSTINDQYLASSEFADRDAACAWGETDTYQ